MRFVVLRPGTMGHQLMALSFVLFACACGTNQSAAAAGMAGADAAVNGGSGGAPSASGGTSGSAAGGSPSALAGGAASAHGGTGGLDEGGTTSMTAAGAPGGAGTAVGGAANTAGTSKPGSSPSAHVEAVALGLDVGAGRALRSVSWGGAASRSASFFGGGQYGPVARRCLTADECTRRGWARRAAQTRQLLPPLELGTKETK